MEIVEIHLNSVSELESHESEPFRREAVSTIEIAFVPFDSGECAPAIIRDCVQSTAEGDTPRGCSALRMVVCLIDIRMEVEVLTCLSPYSFHFHGEVLTSCN